MTRCGKILVAIYIICLLPSLTFAQRFYYTARLNKADTTGFYSITISPQLSAYTKTDFSDIRIADKNKQWIPHILQWTMPIFMEDLFTAFPILRNTITDSGKNLLIIENTKVAGIHTLKLFLKNSAVSRRAVLSGSNNQQDWYIIDDKISITRSYETVRDEYLQEINFPLTKYRFLKIIIDNVHNDPLLITKAGFYAQSGYKKLNIYQDNPVPAFTQKDSNSYSYIEVRQDNTYQFDKLSLSINGPKFYDRAVQICLPGFGRDHIAKPGLVIGNFKLMSALPSNFEFPRVKTPLFFIVIKNADNPPLQVEKVLIQQQTASLITYVEQGKKYDLQFGDSFATFADYDLQTFKDSITMLRSLNYYNITAIKKDALKNDGPGKNRWIWLSLIVAILVLSYLTFRLVGDISKS